MTDAELNLPEWARVSSKRAAHIARVASLMEDWSTRLKLPEPHRQAWIDAARCHDSLRDASETTLLELAGNIPGYETGMLHGPASAAMLERSGEKRAEVIEAVRYHTVGCSTWGKLGRALYMADFLEPGRKFSRADRAYLAARVPDDFDGTFRQVVRSRIEWSLREGVALHPGTVELWNASR